MSALASPPAPRPETKTISPFSPGQTAAAVDGSKSTAAKTASANLKPPFTTGLTLLLSRAERPPA